MFAGFGNFNIKPLFSTNLSSWIINYPLFIIKDALSYSDFEPMTIKFPFYCYSGRIMIHTSPIDSWTILKKSPKPDTYYDPIRARARPDSKVQSRRSSIAFPKNVCRTCLRSGTCSGAYSNLDGIPQHIYSMKWRRSSQLHRPLGENKIWILDFAAARLLVAA
jgi:hypothetical protein